MRPRIVVSFIFGFSAQAQALDVQVTTGNCSPIVNMNFADKAQVERLFGPSPSFEKIVTMTTAALRCADEHIKTGTDRLKALLFALDQLIVLKEDFVRPALDEAMADQKDVGKRERLQKYLLKMALSIDSAITSFINVRAGRDSQLTRDESDRLLRTLRSKEQYTMTSWSTRIDRSQFDEQLEALKLVRTDVQKKLER